MGDCTPHRTTRAGHLVGVRRRAGRPAHPADARRGVSRPARLPRGQRLPLHLGEHRGAARDGHHLRHPRPGGRRGGARPDHPRGHGLAARDRCERVRVSGDRPHRRPHPRRLPGRGDGRLHGLGCDRCGRHGSVGADARRAPPRRTRRHQHPSRDRPLAGAPHRRPRSGTGKGGRGRRTGPPAPLGPGADHRDQDRRRRHHRRLHRRTVAALQRRNDGRPHLGPGCTHRRRHLR